MSLLIMGVCAFSITYCNQLKENGSKVLSQKEITKQISLRAKLLQTKSKKEK